MEFKIKLIKQSNKVTLTKIPYLHFKLIIELYFNSIKFYTIRLFGGLILVWMVKFRKMINLFLIKLRLKCLLTIFLKVYKENQIHRLIRIMLDALIWLMGTLKNSFFIINNAMMMMWQFLVLLYLILRSEGLYVLFCLIYMKIILL